LSARVAASYHATPLADVVNTPARRYENTRQETKKSRELIRRESAALIASE
jgi:hypothetical protein